MSNTKNVSDTIMKQLESHLDTLREFCVVYNLPMFATVAIKNNENETEYKNIVYNAKSHNIELTDDRIRRHMLIANGFEAVLPRENIVIDPETLFDD